MKQIFLFVLCLLAFRVQAQSLNPNVTPFPRASQADFSDLVPTPAGKNGFLTARDGHFYWQNGARAKFWGINVANSTLMESEANIEAMLRNFRASGFNLVRLHHFDERNGILDLAARTSDQFVPERLKKLDFWIAKARENGISVYLDLLDYRRFTEADGVPNAQAIGRGAKPYALFNRRLMELQKNYARQLLRDHQNAYTGQSYADDPTIVMVDIANENGLFIRRGYWRSMPSPYAQEFKDLWNEWLRQKYGSTPNLRAAWSKNGRSELGENENIEAGGVELPALTWETNRLSSRDLPFSSLARRSDGARFAAEIHENYFREMKKFLREEIGLQVPVCATGRFDDLAELRAQSRELDFIAPSFYYDHPYWGGDQPQWKLPSYFHGRNPLAEVGDKSLASQIGLSRIAGKPLVLREWNYCWPNVHRGAGMLEAATLASFQDIDALILFTYELGATAKVGYFSVRSDPARWQMAAAGARIFLGGLVAPAKQKIAVNWTEETTFDYQKYLHPIYDLAWTTRIENSFEGDSSEADLKVSLRAGNFEPSVFPAQNASLLQILNALKARAGKSRASANRQVFFSDSGEIIRNSPGGRLGVNAAKVQVLAGDLEGVRGYQSGLEIQNGRSGALVALSLDGLPLVRSRRYVIKMTADAANLAQQVRRDPRFLASPNGQWMLQDYGQQPVRTSGVKATTPLQISLGGQPVLRVWLRGGSFELLVEGEKRQFYCDTPGVRFQLNGQSLQTVDADGVWKNK